MSRGVNMVPMVVPAMMLRMVLYFIPLQMITLQPCSRAKLADRTFNQSELSIQSPAQADQSEGSIVITLDSMPPVPTVDFSPNCRVSMFLGLK